MQVVVTIAAICGSVLTTGVSCGACQLQINSMEVGSYSRPTNEISKTYQAAAETIKAEFDRATFCSISPTVAAILATCTDGCCYGFCDPIDLKACTDGIFYSAFEYPAFDFRESGSWDVVCTECADDSDCDNGLFCDGAETCDAGVCVTGSAPCQSGEVCNEANDQCVECADNSDCDDGIACNGAETCANSLCVTGSSTCSADPL